ncbi:unnamed protein product [Phytomonas sp. EM1]|nr:unnamed protein product [Phytomonas sp. EM1]|eukprot:CCW64385.1 unnamed protein product [Phytomonas sp. isolate EM1]
MGCGSSLVYTSNKGASVGVNSSQTRNVTDADVNKNDDNAPLSLLPGYLDDDFTGPVECYTDYRGYVTTVSGGASKRRADLLCMWLDSALSILNNAGGTFFDPESLEAWPPDLLV